MTGKIGIDFHGVISAAPGLFAKFCHEIRKRGVKVYVISGGPKKDVVKYLDENRIEYDTVWAILDFYEQQGKAELFPTGALRLTQRCGTRPRPNTVRRKTSGFILTIQAFTGVIS